MSPDGDRIEIRHLRVMARHGVLPEERERAQPFSIDLDVWVDTSAAAAGDDLALTVDYGRLSEAVATLAVTESYLLLESLAQAVATAVLDHDERIGAVEVAVRKLRPPVPLDLGSVGVRIHRRRG